MARVYAWPPVPVIASEWTTITPTDMSRSLATRRSYKSAAEPPRRAARLSVSRTAAGGYAGGYMQVLAEYLQGGAHFVRLRSIGGPNRWQAMPAAERQSGILRWRDGEDALDWRDGIDPLTWITGPVLSGARTTDAGFPAIRVNGLPPSRLVVAPGEFVTVVRDSDGASDTIRAVCPARSNSSGTAIVRLIRSAAFPGRVSIGTSDTAVFEADEIPRVVGTKAATETWDWSFTEVLPEDLDPGDAFEDLDPWA